MSKRKSIVSAFGDFQKDQPSAKEEKKAGRVAAGIIGTTQRTLTQIREERDALLEQAAKDRQVIELEPSVIDPSPFRDRLPDDNAEQFEEFKRSIREEGQKVPVTVRPHPQEQGRFQVVYGHRRQRALAELGHSVAAIVADYSDRDLVIAQGIENANRQDLSWIERALFAEEMKDAGIKTKDIKAALSIDDAELSKLRSVLKAVPKDVVEAIGRAPTVGRPRWLEFAAALNSGGLKAVRKTLSANKVWSSDERFIAAQKSAQPKLEREKPQRLEIGEVGTVLVSGGTIKFNLIGRHKDKFSKFLEAELPAILERYSESLKKN